MTAANYFKEEIKRQYPTVDDASITALADIMGKHVGVASFWDKGFTDPRDEQEKCDVVDRLIASNTAVIQEYLRTSQERLFIQHVGQRGDRHPMSATLASNPDTRLLLFVEGAELRTDARGRYVPNMDQVRKAAGLVNFYKEMGARSNQLICMIAGPGLPDSMPSVEGMMSRPMEALTAAAEQDPLRQPGPGRAGDELLAKIETLFYRQLKVYNKIEAQLDGALKDARKPRSPLKDNAYVGEIHDLFSRYQENRIDTAHFEQERKRLKLEYNPRPAEDILKDLSKAFSSSSQKKFNLENLSAILVEAEANKVLQRTEYVIEIRQICDEYVRNLHAVKEPLASAARQAMTTEVAWRILVERREALKGKYLKAYEASQKLEKQGQVILQRDLSALSRNLKDGLSIKEAKKWLYYINELIHDDALIVDHRGSVTTNLERTVFNMRDLAAEKRAIAQQRNDKDRLRQIRFVLFEMLPALEAEERRRVIARIEKIPEAEDAAAREKHLAVYREQAEQIERAISGRLQSTNPYYRDNSNRLVAFGWGSSQVDHIEYGEKILWEAIADESVTVTSLPISYRDVQAWGDDWSQMRIPFGMDNQQYSVLTREYTQVAQKQAPPTGFPVAMLTKVRELGLTGYYPNTVGSVSDELETMIAADPRAFHHALRLRTFNKLSPEDRHAIEARAQVEARKMTRQNLLVIWVRGVNKDEMLQIEKFNRDNPRTATALAKDPRVSREALHAELDKYKRNPQDVTTVEMVMQVAERLGDFNIILCGDTLEVDPFSPKRQRALGHVAGLDKLVMTDLTQMWTQAPFSGADTTTKQLYFFQALRKILESQPEQRVFCHLGVRSGMLEALVYQGENVIYCEWSGLTTGVERYKKINTTLLPDGRTQSDKPKLPFFRLAVDKYVGLIVDPEQPLLPDELDILAESLQNMPRLAAATQALPALEVEATEELDVDPFSQRPLVHMVPREESVAKAKKDFQQTAERQLMDSVESTTRDIFDAQALIEPLDKLLEIFEGAVPFQHSIHIGYAKGVSKNVAKQVKKFYDAVKAYSIKDATDVERAAVTDMVLEKLQALDTVRARATDPHLRGAAERAIKKIETCCKRDIDQRRTRNPLARVESQRRPRS